MKNGRRCTYSSSSSLLRLHKPRVGLLRHRLLLSGQLCLSRCQLCLLPDNGLLPEHCVMSSIPLALQSTQILRVQRPRRRYSMGLVGGQVDASRRCRSQLRR